MQRPVDLSELLDPAGMFCTLWFCWIEMRILLLVFCPFGCSYDTCNHASNFCSVFAEFAIEQKPVFPGLPDGFAHRGKRQCPTAYLLLFLKLQPTSSIQSADGTMECTLRPSSCPSPFPPDKPGLGVRSFAGAPTRSYDVQFPLARPTSRKVQAICLHSERRPRYPQSYFPSGGYGQQRRQGSAINRLESWYATCCQNNETSPMEVTMCCVTQAVSSLPKHWYCCDMVNVQNHSFFYCEIFFPICLLDFLGQQLNGIICYLLFCTEIKLVPAQICFLRWQIRVHRKNI